MGTLDGTKIGFIGLGLMGHGVAQTAMQAGFDVVGLETDPAFLQNGTNLIEGSLKKVHSRAVKKGKATQEEADAAFAAAMDAAGSGMITFGIPIVRAIRAACKGPAPPKATSAKSRGS